MEVIVRQIVASVPQITQIAQAIQRAPQECMRDTEQILDIPVPHVKEEIVGVPSASASSEDHLTRPSGALNASARDGVLTRVQAAVVEFLSHQSRSSMSSGSGSDLGGRS